MTVRDFWSEKGELHFEDDNYLNLKLSDRDFKKRIEMWEEDYHQQYAKKVQQYRNYYDSIKNNLSENIRQLYEKSLHDAQLLHVDTPQDDSCKMIFDCKHAMHHAGVIKVTFTGVRELDFQLPEGIEHNSWVHEEIYVQGNVFELHAVLDCVAIVNSKPEVKTFRIKVVAQDVKIEQV
ncbi:DUF4085 family protein [Longirhabdus pacifica]|uniref:DUF4085 family protein n=1 Tax=Longirhabdus pacifica TaxID=2305227 RepID=UPI0013E89C58|nr:DUF4085 family protein [Longirhabdus pacifica]